MDGTLFFYLLSFLSIAGWMNYLIRAAYHGSSILPLPREQSTGYSPQVSVIIAGRNEEDSITQCLNSLAAIDYPNIEFIIINDRSTDNTLALMQEAASHDSRIHIISITSLPGDWLGKVNALHTGTEHASGEWLLFSDADIEFKPNVVTSAISYAEKNELDHLALLPDDRSQHSKVLLPLFVFSFGGLFIQRIRAKEIGKPGSNAYVGVGAFNLVRRSTFDKTPGFEWLKMEVIDDGGLGLLIYNAGGKSALLNSNNTLTFEWYPDLRKAIRGLEKNAFGGFAGYSYRRAIIQILWMWYVTFVPFLLPLFLQEWKVLMASVIFTIILPALFATAIRPRFKIRPLIAALLPLGYFFVSLGIVNSMLTAWRQNGLRWRETFYSLDELRQGQRVKM